MWKALETVFKESKGKVSGMESSIKLGELYMDTNIN